MNTSNYPSNSNKSKESQNDIVPKKIEPVTNGKTKKKSEIRKFTDVFVPEDMVSVRDHIFMDIIVPTVKSALSEVVKNAIDIFLYGSEGSPSTKKSTSSHISYRNFYDSNNNTRRDITMQRQNMYNYDEVTIETRGEAEEVLMRMDEIMSRYKVVSVADFYDLVSITGNYTDNKYGWTDISTARIIRNRDGYVIKLPKAMPLD